MAAQPFRKLIDFLASGCYAGRSPFAPGTVGTFVGFLLVLVIRRFFPAFATPWPGWSFTAFAIIISIIAIPIATLAIRYDLYGKDAEDPRQIVIDEIAGYAITIAGHPQTAFTLAAAFVLFRIFDVIKPPPARQAEDLPDGYGIVLDDVMAGVYANLCLWVLEYAMRIF